MARRTVFLHLGLPDSGAGFVEQALLTHAAALADGGLDVPEASAQEMLRAAIEIRRLHKQFGYSRSEVEGSWAEVCRRIFRSRAPRTLISNDLLAAADADQAALLLDGLAGAEVHLVLTARDPGRQVAAGWQEALRAGGTTSFPRFQRRLLEEPEHPDSAAFWAAQDLPGVLDRWASGIRPDRVHLIVVGDEADPRPTIWRHLADVAGFDADALPCAVARAAQPGLGATEMAVLRGVNQAIDGRIDGPLRRRVVKRYFADRVLGAADAALPPVSPETHEALAERAEAWQKRIANAGYDVRGSLDDLMPTPPDADTHATADDPDDVGTKQRLRATTAALADVLVEVARLREHNELLEIRTAKLEKKKRKLKRKLAQAEG